MLADKAFASARNDTWSCDYDKLLEINFAGITNNRRYTPEP